MKQIFLIWACDGWKSTDSQTLLMATTSQQKVKMFVSKELLRGDRFLYGDDSSATHGREKQASEFRKDWGTVTGKYHGLTLRQINDKLRYGLIEYVEDGEEI